MVSVEPGMLALLASITLTVLVMGRDARRREVDEWVKLARRDRKARR